MLFHSIKFFIFFPIVTILYLFFVRVIKKNWLNQLLLLAASLYFYACWNPKYLLLILSSVFITWASGILMTDKPQRYKKIVLFMSLLSNLGILFFFKYYNFFANTINILYTKLHIHTQIPAFNVLLPVGISFYTFQALGYSIDVYRGAVKPEKNIITYALFVTFFPQLVAGPIERTGHLLPQFKSNHDFDYTRVTDGLKLALWGMFKKIVIADQLAVYVDKVYSSPTEYQSIALILATVFFAFQILCDFSGYSDIAIGCAKILGFSLNKNFDSPYLARNIADFWKRWHISLSTWFRDYLYIPLGGNRCFCIRHYFNLLITFILSGLWHGASITFIFWGLIHGLFLVIGNIKNRVCKAPPPPP
ncbi:alginate O-acetyltransferase AlgI family protein, partial [Treponema lecithinolyticum ATCC 700332]